ncbi:hypothetical protein [Mycobacterium sp. 1245801.1]|uniref:hypothetical protein n=1 Tax=Mycobacterium sp. 1245801.1 TaxID=1834075 RepID=UPI0007FCF906|nr:hypothetical protein [Mycobacterium sp. 1245801.1]OBJ16271.1 hypothetical protein A5622_25620 [Mycobacterium sp. 1245801.1]
MSFLYDKYRDKANNGDISWRDDDICFVLLDITKYTADSAGDEFLSDIPEDARVAVSAAVGGKSSTAGAVDCDDPVFENVPATDPPTECAAAAVFRNTGDPATSDLISYHDEGADLPLTPNDGDLTLRISNGVNKLFRR